MSAGEARGPRLNEDLLRQYDEIARPGEPSLIRLLLERLMVSAPARLASIKSAIENGEAARIRQEAHALKGIVGNVGALSLSKILQILEKRGELSQLEDARDLFCEIEAEYISVAEALKNRYL